METNIKINEEKNKKKEIDYSLKESYLETIDKWINILKPKSSNYTLLQLNSDSINNYIYELNTVLENDVARTKNDEMKNYENFKPKLKSILNFYCDINVIKYKQGMNEIMAVFLSMLFKDPSIEIYKIFNCFSLFMDFFLINYYIGVDINAFNSSCSLIDLLLRYHEPKIFNRFNISFITPQIYATNWLLTCYSNKNSLEISYIIYNCLINEMDQALIYYLCIAIFQYHKETILKLESFQILEYITKINIENIEMANQLIKLALKIKENTPYSLYILIKRLQIYIPHSNYIKSQFDSINPHNFKAFPIFPSELLFNVFPSILTCPDYTCINFHNIYNENTWPKIEECKYCLYHKKNDTKINYLILDIRVNDEKKIDYIGMLPNMTILNKKTIQGTIKNNIKIEDYFYEELKEMRKKSNSAIHVILLTNVTEKYEEYEKNLYKENNSNKELLKIKYGLGWNKEKELDNKAVLDYLKKYKQEKKTIEEYDIFRNIINKLTREGCKYISFVYGGYKDVHNLSLMLSIPLVLHNKEKCFFCIENHQNNNKEKEIISKENFDNLCENQDNKVFNCIYNNSRKGIIVFHNNNCKVFSKIKIKNNKIGFKISHILENNNILSYSKTVKDDKKFLIDFLYTINNTLSNLVWINLDLLNDCSLKEFIKICHRNNIL